MSPSSSSSNQSIEFIKGEFKSISNEFDVAFKQLG